MIPQTRIVEKEDAEDMRLQEQFIRQVDDHSLPAEEVLNEQQECRSPDDAPALFVP